MRLRLRERQTDRQKGRKEGTGYKGIEKKSERKETIIKEILEQNPFFERVCFRLPDSLCHPSCPVSHRCDEVTGKCVCLASSRLDDWCPGTLCLRYHWLFLIYWRRIIRPDELSVCYSTSPVKYGTNYDKY